MKTRKHILKALKFTIVAAIIVGTACFFYHEFRINWEQLKTFPLNLKPALLLLAFTTICAAYLINTYAWQYLINHYSEKRKIAFSESISIVNVSQITKYLPGKIWSFGLQMWWLGNKGFSKTLVLFVNLVAMILSLLATTITGFLLFFSCLDDIPTYALFLAFLTVILFFLLLFLFMNPFLKFFVNIINKSFKKNYVAYTISRRALLTTQILYIFAAVTFASGIYLTCQGLDLGISPQEIFLITGTVLISDVVGFIVLISPGGLGIRESVMFVILQKMSTINAALIIPIATRIMTMLADLMLGIIGIILFRKFKKS